MIGVQLILLKVALDNKPPSGAKDGLEHAPFSGYSMEGTLHGQTQDREKTSLFTYAPTDTKLGTSKS